MYFVHTYTGIDSWIQDSINTFCRNADAKVHTVTFVSDPHNHGRGEMVAHVMFEDKDN